MKTRWEKAYKGPFTEEEARDIVSQIKSKADEPKNGIVDANIRRRRRWHKCVCTAACGAGVGHNRMFDVYIKTTI